MKLFAKARHIIMALGLMVAGTVANAQSGAWSGNLEVMGTKLPLVFNFSAEGCTMDSPQQGAKGIKAVWTPQSDGTVSVKIPMINASYEGKLEGTRIVGKFTQNGMSLPLTLTEGAEKPKRPQTPVAPFPYQTEEVTFMDGEVELHGTLTLPEGYSKNTPVVVMVTGSGLQNRDEELFDHHPFAVIADALAKQGIASFRYDDRGYNDDSFPASALTTYHFKCDASAAVSTMRERFRKVGVLGHSEGGTIALQLAIEKKADFIISLAGMAISGRDQLVKQNQAILLASGFPKESVEKYCESLGKGFDLLLAGKNASEMEVPNLPYALTANLQAALKQCESDYMMGFLKLDVSGSLSKIKCPVLAFNGTRDLQVDCESNLRTLKEKLPTNKRNRILTMEGLNHLMQHCQTGMVNEYMQIEETISPEVLDEIVSWVKQL